MSNCRDESIKNEWEISAVFAFEITGNNKPAKMISL